MARSKKARARKASRQQGFPLRFSPLSLAVATAVGSMAGHVMAQEAEDGDAAADGQAIEEVVVTGFRQSLQNAMELKRDSDLIVEAISAEDIGKLPDNSIAEALTRLTGLAGQRLNGRQQVISIRGLAPDFSTALLNGRQQVSSGDNRGVEFDQYPSELLQAVVVYKTPEARLTGQGLAGTVDMRTISPLEYGEQTIAFNVRNEWTDFDSLNPDVDDSGLRYSLSYTDQSDDGTLGWALGFSSIASPGQREVIDLWGYNAFGPEGDALLLTGGNAFSKSGQLERDGVMAVLEYQPNDRVNSTIDVYRSSFDETTLVRQIGMPLFPNWYGWSYGTSLSNAQVSDGLITGGTYNNVKTVLSHNLEARDASLWAAGWNLEADIGETWTATVDISHSAIDRQDIILGLNTGTGPHLGDGAVDTIDFSIGGGAPVFASLLDYTAPGGTSLTSPQGWGGWGSGIPGGQVGYDNRPSIDDELTQIRLSAERYMDGPISSVEFGVQLDSRSKSRINSDEGFLALTSGELTQEFTSTGNVTIPFGLPAIATFDPIAMWEAGTYRRVDNFHSGVLAGDWSVDEDVSLAYVQFGVDTEWGSTPVTGNFGVQVVSTDQSSIGKSAKQGQALSAEAAGQQQVSGGASYTDVLPSLNLNFLVADGQFVRLGVARTLARARMDELRASRQVNFNSSLANSTDPANSPWGGNGGNPALEPWRANSIDLAYEWYFQDGLGYFAVAAFYKDLLNYIYNLPVLTDFSEFPTGDVTPALTSGFVTRPANGDGGVLSGYELSLQLAGDLIAPELAPFGAVLNASFTDSEIERGTGDPATPLPGLSDTVYNITLYYEQGGFSARVSQNYRSDFLGEVQGFGSSRTLRSITEETLIDAQVSYSFPESGPVAGLTLYLQGTNLTNEPFTGFLNNDHRQIKDWQEYGATYFFGGSYRF